MLAVLFLVAIWLPSVLLSDGTDPTMLVVNMVLTCASLLVLAPSRRRRRSRFGPPRLTTHGKQARNERWHAD